jgi:RND family efflux transporter MFP subunit
MNPNKPVAIKLRTLRPIAALAMVACLCAHGFGQGRRSAKGVSIGSSTSLTYEGFTEPKQDIMVAANELGRLASLDVEIGDSVEAGEVIGHLEDALQKMAVKLSRVQVAMTGELEATKAEVELNRSRTIQLRHLIADEMARPDELTRAETDLRIAVARRDAALEQLELRKVELQRYELQLDRRKLRAPTTGVIANIFHHPGEYITPGDPAIVRLMVIDTLYAVFNLPVEDTQALRIGDMARVFLRSSSTTVKAAITSIAPNIDGESGTVQVRVELDNPERKLLSGDRCTLQILYGESSDPARAAANQENSSTR